MKYLAPAVITTFISWVLYRETGTWTPTEVYPKAQYDQDANGSARRRGVSSQPQFYERSRDLLEERELGGVTDFPKPGGTVTQGFTKKNPITLDA